MSETAPVNSPMQPTTAIASTDDSLVPDDQFDVDVALLRLLLGGMLLGADELRSRLQRWEKVEAPRSAAQVMPPVGASEWLRYALVGMAFEAESRMRQGFSALVTRLERLADESNLAYTRLSWSLRWTPFDPALRRLEEALFLTSEAMDRWADRGWLEEQLGRRMAEQATVSVLDELFDYMSRNPEVRHLIEQQGMSAAGSAVDEVRERTASADQWIERLAHSLLRRPPMSEKPPEPTDRPTASPLANEIQASPAPTRARTLAPEAEARTHTAATRAEAAHSGASG